MATPSVPNTLVPSVSAKASDVNGNFAALVAFLNGQVVQKDGSIPMTGLLTLSGSPTASNHAATKAYVDSGSLTTWASYTPTLAQGGASITKTVNSARYITAGKLTIVEVQLTSTANGTSGALSVSLPSTSISYSTSAVLGDFYYSDATASQFRSGVCRSGSTTTLNFYFSGTPTALGGAFQSKSGAIISLSAAYETP